MASFAPPIVPSAGHVDCDLSIVIVSWNVWSILAGCLRSIEHASRAIPGEAYLRSFGPQGMPAVLEVIVVDNASSDATKEELPQAFPWVRLIASSENLGFTRGNNLGYTASRGHYIYFLNPDTELDQDGTHNAAAARGLPPPHDSLWVLYAAIADASGIGMVGPQLRYPDGEQQPSVRRFPSPPTGFFESTWLGRFWRGNPWSRRMHMADWPVEYRHNVDWVVGAAMLCRRRALEDVRTSEGPFDERFFMYSEELDLCRRLRLEEWRVVYVPEAVVTHYEARSSDQASAARHINFNTSKVRYYEKWFDRPWPDLLRRYLLLEFRSQLWIERAKLLLRSKPELRRQRIEAYRQVLRSGLR
ncbi:MAG: glycosyltransferase family 2 protein [Caldilineaceae bacterium]